MVDAVNGFEANFAERLAAQWGRGPHVFRDALRTPIFTQIEFMTALRGAAQDYAAAPSSADPPGRLFLSGEQIKRERLPPLMPQSAAETADQYVTRVRQAYPQDEIGIILDNCEKHVPSMRDRLVPPLHYLFSRVGYPARRNHLCVYAGTYRTTPFGIHRDDCHVLMFCGMGTKSMAFWPRDYFDPKRQWFGVTKLRVRVPDHIGRATVLEIGPRDVLYWSDQDWHVAVSDRDQFHAALSVGIYHVGSSAEALGSLDVLEAAIRVDEVDIGSLPAAPGGRLSGDALRSSEMAGFFDRWERLRDALNRPGEAEFHALRRALRLISSAGYGKERAARLEALPALQDSELVCAVPDSLVAARARNGLMIGANGSVFFYDAASASIENAVLSLRDGPRRFDALVGSVESAAAEQLTAIIGDLIGAGAVAARS